MPSTRLLFVHALSPLHAGTGQGVGVIDLPIAREKATGLPYLPGSSLKGSLRAVCAPDKRNAVFGPEDSEYAGAIVVADARLLLLPVRSVAGTFAWVTSPYALRRCQRDARDAGISRVPDAIPAFSESELQTAKLHTKTTLTSEGKIYLEDLDLIAATDATIITWATWLAETIFAGDSDTAPMVAQHLCVVHDDVLGFLLETATEITARIRLDPEKKTVAQGALWYEEALPAETILMSLAVALPNAKTDLSDDEIFKVIEQCADKPMQLGGKSTVGRGLCRVRLTKGA